MGLAKTIRLNRLFSNASGRLCSVAVDHFLGYNNAMTGLKDMPATIRAVVAGRPDAVTMQRGMALGCWGEHAGKVPLIIQTTAAKPDDSADEEFSTPVDAVAIGADAFATCAFVRGATEAMHVRRVADAVRVAAPWDMPVILHTYPRVWKADGSVDIVFDPENIYWAVRCGIEAGVDIIKVPYTGDPASYGEIVRMCPVPIVAAGGPKCPTLRCALEMAAGVVKSGAKGMTIGRNVWGVSQITEAVKAFKLVIHDGKTPDEAMKLAGIKE